MTLVGLPTLSEPFGAVVLEGKRRLRRKVSNRSTPCDAGGLVHSTNDATYLDGLRSELIMICHDVS
jgi:hypothetical protein